MEMDTITTLAVFTAAAAASASLALLALWGAIRALLSFVGGHTLPRRSRPDGTRVATRRTVPSVA